MSGSVPFFESGAGLLTVGLCCCLTGFIVFCCIDVFWLKKELRTKHDTWTQLGNNKLNQIYFLGEEGSGFLNIGKGLKNKDDRS